MTCVRMRNNCDMTCKTPLHIKSDWISSITTSLVHCSPHIIRTPTARINDEILLCQNDVRKFATVCFLTTLMNTSRYVHPMYKVHASVIILVQTRNFCHEGLKMSILNELFGNYWKSVVGLCWNKVARGWVNKQSMALFTTVLLFVQRPTIRYWNGFLVTKLSTTIYFNINSHGCDMTVKIVTVSGANNRGNIILTYILNDFNLVIETRNGNKREDDDSNVWTAVRICFWLVVAPNFGGHILLQIVWYECDLMQNDYSFVSHIDEVTTECYS